jgi:hypothetical protein
MAETENIFASQGPDGSFLGKYYCRLILGDYERTRPFAPGSWKIENGQTIFLPLPRELSDSTSGRYNEESIEGIGDIVNRDPLGLTGRTILTNIGPGLGAIGEAATDALGGAGKMIASAAENAGITSRNITSALQSVTGYAPNPNPSVLFTGPDMRDITFSWAFYPKNYEEAEKVDKTIKILKQAALPTPAIGNVTGVLEYPKLCQINFFPWDTGGNSNSWGWTDKSIIRIKKCFLSSVNASYSDFGNPAFFHSPDKKTNNYSVTYRLNITFKEVEFMLSRDWGDGVAKFDDSLDGVANTSIFDPVVAVISNAIPNKDISDGKAVVTDTATKYVTEKLKGQ